MFTVLLRSLPDVRTRLFELVDRAPRPLLVAQERELGQGGAFERRQPYRYLLEHGAKLAIILVADDGVEGLWRDPVGELAERHFTGKREIAEATAGYQLYRKGRPAVALRRDLWDPLSDVRAIAELLSLDIPLPPKPVAEPQRKRPRRPFEPPPHVEPAEPPPPRGARTRPPQPPPREPPPPREEPAPAEPPAPDPFAVLGLPPDADEESVKRAFRSLVVQYHPDKVAHLGPEFRELAEKKTRELTSAYDAAQRRLRGESDGS